MCPTHDSTSRLPQPALDRLHELAVTAERVQTAAETLAGKGHAAKVAHADALKEARRMLGQSRALAAVAERLVNMLEG